MSGNIKFGTKNLFEQCYDIQLNDHEKTIDLYEEFANMVEVPVVNPYLRIQFIIKQKQI